MTANRTMYDGVPTDAADIKAIFKAGNLVAYYANGDFAWTDAELALFPTDSRVSITPTASGKADVLDVETGDATPAQTLQWIKDQKATGYYRPTIYCSLDTVPAVRIGTGPYILGKDYDLWVADWDGTTALPYPSAVAKQYRSSGSFDTSVVFDSAWPHRTATPEFPAVQTGWVHSDTTNLIAKVVTHDGGKTWLYVA
jgi:hypothetical protein